MGNAGVQPSRNNRTNGNKKWWRECLFTTSFKPFIFVAMPLKTQKCNHENLSTK
jgi:hypothetical protein